MKNEKCKIVAIEHVTLDGVYQAPGRSDEDTRNNFKHGGWSVATSSPQLQKIISKYMSGGWSLLSGRITYEHLFEGWGIRQPSSDMAKSLRVVQKFVASHDAGLKLPWENSTLLAGDVMGEVRKLKKDHDKTLVIFGSGVLVRSLLEHGLMDELLLMSHPLALGEGYRLLDDVVSPSRFKLKEEITTDTGVIAATYWVINS